MRSTAVLRWSVGPLRRGESALKDIYNCRLEIFYNCGKAVGKSLVHSGNNGGRGKSKKEMDKVRVKWVNGVHGLRQLRKKSSLPSCWRWMEEKVGSFLSSPRHRASRMGRRSCLVNIDTRVLRLLPYAAKNRRTMRVGPDFSSVVAPPPLPSPQASLQLLFSKI